MENFSDVQIVELAVSQMTIYSISIILESQVATVRILEQKPKLLNPRIRLASFSQDHKSFRAVDLYHNVNSELLDNLHPTLHMFHQLALILSKSYFLLLIALIVYAQVLTIPKHRTIQVQHVKKKGVQHVYNFKRIMTDLRFHTKILILNPQGQWMLNSRAESYWFWATVCIGDYILNPKVLATAFLMVK